MTTNGRLAGKVALVTGGASDPGLGRSTALALAREGARVAVTDIDLPGAEATVAAIRAAGGEAIAVRHDVTAEPDWDRAIEATTEHFGPLSVLVNNAGIAILKPMRDLSLADWNRQIEVNLTSVFLGCRAAMGAMQSAGGSIVNLSSVAGLVGLATTTAYAAAKGGVRSMTKAVAIEGAATGIRCNSVHPGVIWTNMQAGATGLNDPSGVDARRFGVPLGTVGEPQDIADCIVYLASDESKYVTGAEFVVDGGMTAR